MSLVAANPQAEPDDYELVNSDSAWITVRSGDAAISVYVKRTDEGVVVDLFPYRHEIREPLATTYAFFAEATEAEGVDSETGS